MISKRIVTLALALAVVGSLAACSSSSDNSSPSTTAAPTPTDAPKRPTRGDVRFECGRAKRQHERLGGELKRDGAQIDYAALGTELTDVSQLVGNCQTAVGDGVPGLPADVQGPATAYAQSLDGVIAALNDAPTGPTPVGVWVQQLADASAAVARAEQALLAADPDFRI